MLLAVSLKDSPFVRLLDFSEIEITSASRLLAATSKATLVLVLGSRNKFTTRFPFKFAGAILLFDLNFLNCLAVSSKSSISSELSSWIPRSDLLFHSDFTIKVVGQHLHLLIVRRNVEGVWGMTLYFR